jgi:hypothetical protein
MKSFTFILITVVLATIVGCHSQTVQVNDGADLQNHIGDPVRIEGFQVGPGKPADYILFRGGWVYLTGTRETGDEDVARGKPITAEGILRFKPYSASSNVRFGVRVAQPDNYFYIHNAKVRLRPQPAENNTASEPAQTPN